MLLNYYSIAKKRLFLKKFQFSRHYLGFKCILISIALLMIKPYLKNAIRIVYYQAL